MFTKQLKYATDFLRDADFPAGIDGLVTPPLAA